MTDHERIDMNQPLFDQTQPANTSAGDPLETYLAKHNLTPKDLMNANGSFTRHALAFAFEHGGANPGADPRLFVSSLEGGLKRLIMGVVDVKENPEAQTVVKAIVGVIKDFLKVLPSDIRPRVVDDLRNRESLHRVRLRRALHESQVQCNTSQLKAAVEIVWQEYQGGSR